MRPTDVPDTGQLYCLSVWLIAVCFVCGSLMPLICPRLAVWPAVVRPRQRCPGMGGERSGSFLHFRSWCGQQISKSPRPGSHLPSTSGIIKAVLCHCICCGAMCSRSNTLSPKISRSSNKFPFTHFQYSPQTNTQFVQDNSNLSCADCVFAWWWSRKVSRQKTETN